MEQQQQQQQQQQEQKENEMKELEKKKEEEEENKDKHDDGDDSEDEDFVPEKEGGDDDEGEDENDPFDDSADNEGIKHYKKKTNSGKQGEEEETEEEENQKPSDAQSLYAQLKAKCAVKGPSITSTATTQKVETKKEPEKNEKVTVTTVYDFAGEKVTVTKDVPASAAPAQAARAAPSGQKRGGGLLSSILGPKPKKMSTLEKSKLDWQKYKYTSGISETLNNVKKSNDSFLEKKAFLDRTEQRQYELEREMRLSKKK